VPIDPAATPVDYISLAGASGRYSEDGIVALALSANAVLYAGEEARRAYMILNKEQLGASRSAFSGDSDVPEYARVGRQSGVGPDPRTPEQIKEAEEAAKREAKKAKMSPAQRVAATKKDADADLRKEFGIQELGPNPTIEEQQAYLNSMRSARSLKSKGFTSFAAADAAGAYDAKAANQSRFEAKYGISFQDAVVQNLGKYRSPAELKRALREKSPVYQQQRSDQAAAQAKIGLEKALAEIADFAKSRNLDPARVLTNQSLLLEAARESGDIRSLEDTRRARAAAERGLSPGELARLPGPNVRRGFALTPTERFEIEETQEGTPAQRAALERERLSRMAERGITPGPEWRGKLEEARDISAISGGVRKIESLFDKMDRQLLTYEQSQLRLSEAIVPPDAYESKADKEAALDIIRKELNSIKNRLTGYYDRASKQLGYPVESLEDVERSGSTFSEGAVARVPDVYKIYDIEIGNLESLLDSVKNTPVARQSNPGAAYSTRRQAARDRIEERRSALRSRNPGGRAGQPSECLQVFCECVGVPNPDLSGTTCDPHCESARAEAFCELICSLSPTSRDAHSLMRLNPSFTPCDWAKKAASIAKSATAGSPQDRQRAIDLVSDCVCRCVECG
jgi:hypothetical protein